MRQLHAQDWPLFLRLHREPGVLDHVADPMDEAQIRQRFDERLPAWHIQAPYGLCLLISEREDGQPVGVTGFLGAWQPHRQAEVGYLLLPEQQGRGYATESLREVVRFALVDCGYHKLTATVTAGNAGSRKVLEKVGFRLEGVLREHFLLRGEWCDDWVFGLLHSEWCPATG
ncbi:GNAT family N-acetyltransferase [Neisseriaceae bacterium JH1-16]|nr:GNAT family N-acetyltransferase [Neisseriaceae bacterium JH1-16]